LCLIRQLPELLAAGILSFKIEGRMKSVHYLATVIRVYRAALDRVQANPGEYSVADEWMQELDKAASRRYTTGFWQGPPGEDGQEYNTVRVIPEWEYAGIVKAVTGNDNLALVEQKNHLQLGDMIEVLQPSGELFRQTLDFMTDLDGISLQHAPHPRQLLYLRLNQPVGEYSMIRRCQREKQ
jgi:U32 family peptidase